MEEYTRERLKYLQSLPLEVKIKLTENRIKEWIDYFGVDGVYVSFSGGKDSTVLLNIVRNLYQDVKAVFIDTGLEYPEIRKFVKTFKNVDWIKPKLTFKEVIQKYGYPFISKEVSKNVYYARKSGETNIHYKKLFGLYKDKEGNKSQYCTEKYKFLYSAPFIVSDRCCSIMKKLPSKKYERETGRKRIVGTMASESYLRTSSWVKTGCNSFNGSTIQSKPLSFWNEEDILKYIKANNISYCSVYGEIIEEDGKLKTTGLNRTGCMFCGYGCHLEKENQGRFEIMKHTHTQQYKYIMKPMEEGGLNYKEIIDWINEHGNLHIRY